MGRRTVRDRSASQGAGLCTRASAGPQSVLRETRDLGSFRPPGERIVHPGLPAQPRQNRVVVALDHALKYHAANLLGASFTQPAGIREERVARREEVVEKHDRASRHCATMDPPILYTSRWVLRL